MNISILSCCLIVQLELVLVVLTAHTPSVGLEKPNNHDSTQEVNDQNQDGEIDEEAKDDITTTTTSTTARPDETGESRAAIGIPTDPHGGLKVAFKPPYREIRRDQHTKISATTRPIPGEHHFIGLGIQLDNKHVLMDHEIWSQSHQGLQDAKFRPINPSKPEAQIDVSKPGPRYFSSSGYQLRLKSGPLNRTNLRVYSLENDLYAVKNSAATPAKLETNPNEFGKDCHVHGYGQAKGSSFDPNTGADFWGTTMRTHVKAPLMPIMSGDCDERNSCGLRTHPDYNFCANSGAGSPVFCGSDQKLTYMAKYRDTSAECQPVFSAYHIPRLVSQMELS